ncbi:Holliday junction resolvase [Candidatus Woesearchaeota archaeon CG08_land_8_20_14_0_20_47_9]|nr:MAG: hypothetical protein AUJ69_04060 [Candidatus Woesearchaeota archaeon CG1_02_47_18]PIO03091.1 MAG: Holliday junction resolvase [Candidatus Woesearchaeota archaeon CG08_land_8_20_14_0_20_47_9]
MSRKSKGINAERELIHLFWEHGWAAIRVAGSGSSKYPSPDVLAGNNLRRVAVECKTCHDLKKYFKKKEIHELKEFAALFGAEPWVGIRFDTLEWYFLSIDDLEETDAGYAASLQLVKLKGLIFSEIIG